QNAQKTGDDTSSELRAKINVVGGYLDDAANDNYVLLVKLAAGSEDIPTVDIVVQMQCGTNLFTRSANQQNLALEEMATIEDGITNVATMQNDQGYGMQIEGIAACNTEESIPVFIHVKGAGSTYEVLQITDRTDGAAII
ncbi:MAG: hypothetical protein VXZ47_03225, partial [Candidatus Thermoplasmatota archaeon]|nr:hypothetical protein [Candidatus Thermoplasmatota archaeon]